MALVFPFNAGKQPDRGLYASVVYEANNVVPMLDGFGPWPSLFVPASAQALPSEPRGVFSLILNSGLWAAYEFTASTLYALAADFTISSIATGYACTAGYDWSALHFGTKLLYTNPTDGLHSYDVEAGGAPSYISAAGDPAYIFSCANFLVGLNCKDASGNRDIRLIKTSGFNDQTNWTTDGADYQELADGEQLYCGFDLSNNAALLVQQNALVLMQFGGASGGAQFSLRKVSSGKGAVGARACVSFDNLVFLRSTDDFYMFSLATGLVPIGADEIATDFRKEVDQAEYVLVQCAVDPEHKIVQWRYKRSIDASLTVSEVSICYEYHLKRWFRVTEQISYLARLATIAVTYDTASGTYDSNPIPYDSAYWAGGSPVFGGLDGSYKFGLRSGASLQGQITTRIDHSPVTRRVLWAALLSDALAPTLQVGTTDQPGTAVTWSSAVTKNDDGRFPFDDTPHARDAQFRVTIPAGDIGATGAGWSYANGVVDVVAAGGGPK